MGDDLKITGNPNGDRPVHPAALYSWAEFYPDYQLASANVRSWCDNGDSPDVILKKLRELFSLLYPSDSTKAGERLRLVVKTISATDRHREELSKVELIEINPVTKEVRTHRGVIKALHHLIVELGKEAFIIDEILASRRVVLGGVEGYDET